MNLRAPITTPTYASVPFKRWMYVIPVAVVMYMLAYLDRNNVAVILQYVSKDMPLSNSAKGTATGIFFIGYMFLQIPGAILAARWSARKTVFILMIAWGLAAMACGLVQTETQLYVARFFLGVFEGGVWPAVLILIASWFPQVERAQANALWMVCLPLSNMLMAPLTGVLLTDLSWRTVFVIEGIPPLLWAIVWWFAVADRPGQAKWLSRAEREYVESALVEENAGKPADVSYKSALRDRRVLLLIGAYFCWMTGFYGFSLWLPGVVKSITHNGTATMVGWLSAIPYTVAMVAMLANAAWSDNTGNRRLAVALPLSLGAGFLLLGQFVSGAGAQMLVLCGAAACVFAPYGPFWAIPGQKLRLEVVAVAMGLINAIGNLGGFLGPYLVGWISEGKDVSFAAFAVLAAFLVGAVVITLLLPREPREPAGADGLRVEPAGSLTGRE